MSDDFLEAEAGEFGEFGEFAESAEFADSDIAVVGSAVHLPGARNADEYWQNLRQGVESIRRYSDEHLRGEGVSRETLRNPDYVRAGAPLEDMEYFDAGFFNFSPRDASIMDPQHRHFLECAWEALENAGHPPERFDGSIGVFAGCGMNAYMMFNILTNQSLVDSVGMFLLRHTGNDKDFLATRVSYELDLKGPSVNVQTACSTSLVAIHTSCQSLLNLECDMALAGGTTIELPHRQGYVYQVGEILSPTGHCYAFDHRAQGTLFGSGAGIVVLRRLADALADGDQILAVIKGSAINNDGAGKVGYLAPSVDGHATAVTEALSVAEIDAATINYIETHGTGTEMGDPIEVAALTQAFRQFTEENQFCGIGSVKTNIGHLDTAAGVASFVKVVEALRHREIPPSLNYEQPNPNIEFESSPFYVNAELAEWTRGATPRRAGVSSLGVGGTNAHVILEEAPRRAESDPPTRQTQVLPLSAKSRAALDAGAARLAAQLRRDSALELADVAHTLQVGRASFDERLVLAAASREEAIRLLETPDRLRVFNHRANEAVSSTVFMFPGGGAQHTRMGIGLYESEPIFEQWVDRGLELLAPMVDYDPRSALFSDPVRDFETEALLDRPSVQLPLIMIVEYALAQLWISLGVEPSALIGHSMGENTAACVAGVMSFEDCLGLVALRGKLFEEVPEGGMMSVALSAEELRARIPDELDLASVNAPELCVVSGPVGPLDEFAKELDDLEIPCQRVGIAIAAHSKMLEPILERFGEYLESISLSAPQIPIISNRGGRWLTDEEATDPGYWVAHLRSPVLFADGIACLSETPGRAYLEVGPGKTLSSLTKQHDAIADPQTVISSMRHPGELLADELHFFTSFGRLWAAGSKPDWSLLHEGDRRLRVALPTYAFQRERYWIEPGVREVAAGALEAERSERLPFDEWFSEMRWAACEMPGSQSAGFGATRSNWLVFTEAFSEELADRLEAAGQSVVRVRAGNEFERLSQRTFVIDADNRADYAQLMAILEGEGRFPNQIVHAWSVTGPDAQPPAMECLGRGFYSVFHLARSLANRDTATPLRLVLLSDGMQVLDADTRALPEKATLLGPCRVIPREMPEIVCHSWDLPLERRAEDAGALVERILRLLQSEDAPAIAALRDGLIWIPERTALDPTPSADEATVRLRERGVYLITGGLGGVGLAMAQFLAEEYRARLVLVGRRGLPEADDDAAMQQRLRNIQRLEEAGAEVLVLGADVCSSEDLAAVLAKIDERFGELHGVIHAAGVLEDGIIATKEVESATRVLDAKVHGTLALDQALRGRALDFMALFSSTSAQLGLAGQVDYTAANAFLNNFARARQSRGDGYTVALGWGTWGEVGMAAEAARTLGLVAGSEEPFGTPELHPLLGERFSRGDDEHVFIADYAVADLWILDEHRIRDFGALLPGTGYVELLRAAFESIDGADAVRLEQLAFIAPLRVPDEGRCRVRIGLVRDGDGFECSVMSRAGISDGGEELWVDHAQARVCVEREPASAMLSVGEISRRCDAWELELGGQDGQTKQEQHLLFGPRWKNLVSVRFGAGEAIASLALPHEFVDDLSSFSLHPALLDLATGFGLPLIDGYEDCDDLYVPMVYDRISIYRPLPARFFSHVVSRSDGGSSHGVVSFDVTLLDGQGHVLVEIEGFSMRRIAPENSLEVHQASGHPLRAPSREAVERVSGPLGLLQRGVQEGIRPREGAEALRRVLASGAGPEVIVSSLDLAWLLEQAAPPARKHAAKSEGPASGVPASESDPVQASVAAIWSDLLGIDAVGLDDEFFDVGGHSLLGIRVINRLNKEFSIHLEPAMLFESPTVGLLSEVIRTMKPELAEGAVASAPHASPTREPKLATAYPVEQSPKADLAAIARRVPEVARTLEPTNSKRPYAMREHWLCKYILAPLFAIPRRRPRAMLEWLIFKLENGEWFSVTLRKLYARHFDMHIGDYTGSCFNRGQFKDGTRIGRYCSIFPTARIETANHPSNTVSSNGLFYRPGPGFSRGHSIPRQKVEIGNDVHIGHNATILFPAQKIGDGAIIGTGAIVDFDVPPYAIVAGTPAAIIRYRFSKERIAELLESKWWNATLEDLEEVRDEFIRPLDGKAVR